MLFLGFDFLFLVNEMLYKNYIFILYIYNDVNMLKYAIISKVFIKKKGLEPVGESTLN